MTSQQIDTARSEAFAGRMTEMLNSAALMLMTSVGHQTGLFDAMNGRPPSTSDQIAQAAKLNERYVREWLGAMVTGRIVDYDRHARTYSLPAEHAAWLTTAAGSDNLALQARYIPMLAQVEDGILDAFRHGGGVPYSAYTHFHEAMAAESSSIHDAVLVSQILPLVPGLVDRLKTGIDVLDVGCGSGHAVNLIAEAFPNSRAVGYDFSEEGITAARAEASRMGLTNARFEVRDVTNLDEETRYGLITAFDAIHDQAQPASVLRGISTALRPNGTFLMVDIAASSELADNIDRPFGPLLYTISTMHCMTVSLALGGVGLGTVWGEQLATQMLNEAGFSNVEIKHIEGDPFNVYYIAQKG